MTSIVNHFKKGAYSKRDGFSTTNECLFKACRRVIVKQYQVINEGYLIVTDVFADENQEYLICSKCLKKEVPEAPEVVAFFAK